MVFPVAVSAVGIFVCLICSFIATDIKPVKQEKDVEMALKVQLISTTILMIPAVYLAAETFLPGELQLRSTVGSDVLPLHPWQAMLCVVMGAVGRLVIGLIIEYYTSHSYKPSRWRSLSNWARGSRRGMNRNGLEPSGLRHNFSSWPTHRAVTASRRSPSRTMKTMQLFLLSLILCCGTSRG